MAQLPIKDFCNVFKGKTGIKGAQSGQYPLITTAGEHLTSSSFDFEAKGVCLPLVSSTGHGHASINRLHYVEGKFALGSILCVIIPKEENVVSSKYLYYYLYLLKDVLIVPLMKGSANVSLSLEAISNISVEIPSIEAQNKFVTTFDKTQREYNYLKKKFSVQENKLDALKDSLLHEAFNGLLSKGFKSKSSEIFDLQNPFVVEKGLSSKKNKGIKWRQLSLSDVCLIKMGQSPPGDSYNDKGHGVPLVNGPVEFSDGDFGLSIKSKFTTSPTQMASAGDMLLCVRGSTTGRTNIAGFDTCIGRGVASITPYIFKPFIFYYIVYIKKEILEMGTGLKFPSVSKNQINDLRIQVPPFEEQKFIVKRTEDLLKNVNKLSDLYNQTKTNAEKLFRQVSIEAFNKYLDGKYQEVSDVFSFLEKPKRHMKQQTVINSGKDIDLTLESINEQYTTNQFTFSELIKDFDLNYESAKEAIFKLLKEGESDVRPFLKLIYSKETSQLYFNVVS